MRKTWVYSGGPYLNTHFTAAEQAAWGDRALWIAGYPNFYPPLGWNKGAAHTLHQFTNKYQLPGMTHLCDMSRVNPSNPLEPTMAVPIIVKGSKLGIHSIQPGTTIPLVKQAIAAGWHWPLVKILHDASACVDVKAISPQTLTICRYMPPSVDDEGLQNVDQWSTTQMVDWAARLIELIFARTPANQMAAVDYWDVTNEPGAHGVTYYLQLGLAFCCLVNEADRRGIHLSLPALPQGVPEWAEMQALVGTGLFGLMKKGGHIFDLHEGTFTDQAVDFGFGDVIPGAQPVPGAGSTNFRHRYLYSLLAERGEIVPLVISEFYGGGRYSNSPADQLARFAWYDQRARQEPYLLAFCPFTINPDGGWHDADYGPTYASPELWQYIAAEKDLPNATGDDTVDTQAALTAIRAAQASLTTAAAALTENKHTLAGLDNQAVINLFKATFGADYWLRILDAKLGAIADARTVGYVGPAIEDLPHLTADQKAALIAGL